MRPKMLLIRLSGHSGAGKSRLTRALAGGGVMPARVVLYTSRLPRPGEIHGVDYYFLSRGAIAALPEEQFLIRPVRNILQAVDLMQLEMDLKNNGVALIEIFHDLWPDLVQAMNERVSGQLRTTSVFLTAVDPDALRGPSDDDARAIRIRNEVAELLRLRGKDSPADIVRRSESAAGEVLEALSPRGTDLYDRVIHSSPEGVDGEDDWTREGRPVGRAAIALEQFSDIVKKVTQ